MAFERKLNKLKQIIRDCGSCLIAFSGGLDSSFLLSLCAGVLPKNNLLAITANSKTYPQEELLSAKKFARKIGVRHKIINTAELENKKFVRNSYQRCYFCKKDLFLRLKGLARKYGLSCVIDASNISDEKDFRPGRTALKELGVFSPLVDAGFTKKDIRKLSKKMKLDTWDKPSMACLASRVPYGIKITADVLSRIQKAESFLKKIGFRQVRVRDYRELCRIEVEKKYVPLLVSKRLRVLKGLKEAGYNYVTLDLAGYRTGSLNENLKDYLCRKKS
ncbi:MAG: ATP-dependent sacrificial sulfur transferase LarE [Candidatus Omnitrophica bacterium]|nr:ATP-dependent sacrificial sulfur transferase LarE [Candidatus Omnitrophota bacterium]